MNDKNKEAIKNIPSYLRPRANFLKELKKEEQEKKRQKNKENFLNVCKNLNYKS